MGIGTFFGIKTAKIVTNEKMSLEELYQKIQDVPFEAGKPEFVKHGFNNVIAFPKIDRENQVWIIGKDGKFTIQRSTIIAGVGNMIKNDLKAELMDGLTGGISGMISTFGSPKKTCMALVDKTADTINGLNL